MITLKRLLQLTPRDILSRARKQCRVRILKSVIDADDMGNHKFVLANVKATDGDRTAAMKFYQLNKRNLLNSETWVYCSCPYFKYYLEVALTSRGSASIIESNGEFPFIRNPSMKPYLCKHLSALARKAPTTRVKEVKPGKITQQEVDLMLKQMASLVEGL
jgi:hypothetical protein